MSQDYALSMDGVTLGYPGKVVLDQASLRIPRGTISAILGPNGAGKSTLVKGMLGLLKASQGQISIPSHESIAYVPQSDAVDWDFPATVLDVVLMGCYGRLGWLKRPGKAEKAKAMENLEKLSMESLANRQINQLSGGQKQRIFLARALMQEASLYLLDEPLKGVDIQTEKTLISRLKELQTQGKTIILVHHDLHTVEEYFDWVTFVQGTILASGPVEEVFTPENLKNCFGKGNLLEMRV